MSIAEPPRLRNRCHACLWFAPQEGYPGGHCWRFPPVVIAMRYGHGNNADTMENARPYVGENEGCGEWSKI